MNEEIIKIAIADDHQMVLDGLQLIISQESSLRMMGTAHNGLEVLDLLAKEPVEVLLLDINMPIMNGIDTMKIIGKEYPNLAVLGLSMLDDTIVIKKLIKYGARGFLLKNSGKEKIIEAITEIHQGQKYFDKAIINKLLENDNTKSIGTSLFPKLSRREKEILSLIIQEHTTQEISDALFISFGTVETHRRNIINKLGVRNTAGMVRVALEYQLLEE